MKISPLQETNSIYHQNQVINAKDVTWNIFFIIYRCDTAWSKVL